MRTACLSGNPEDRLVRFCAGLSDTGSPCIELLTERWQTIFIAHEWRELARTALGDLAAAALFIASERKETGHEIQRYYDGIAHPIFLSGPITVRYEDIWVELEARPAGKPTPYVRLAVWLYDHACLTLCCTFGELEAFGQNLSTILE